MKIKDMLALLEKQATPICLEAGAELWDITFEKEGPQNFLTVFIDSENGVDIDTCEKVSRALDPILDAPEYDSFPAYTFCVSSPGLERRLTKPEHYKWAEGKKVCASLFHDKGDGQIIVGEFGGEKDGKFYIGDKAVDKTDVSSLKLYFEF